MMLITKVHIEKFRGFHDQEFEVGSMLTAIAGQNGTQKSTLLGMITQTFTLGKDKNPMGCENLYVEEIIALHLVTSSDFLRNLTNRVPMSGHCRLMKVTIIP